MIAHVVLKHTVFGRYVCAIGGNAEAARLSGINVNRYKLLIYTWCGVFVGIAGWVMLSRLNAGYPAAALSPGGSFCGPPVLFRHSGHGPDPVRQEEPHAHSIQFLHNAPRAFACDLGTDQIVSYGTDPPDGLRPIAGEALAAPAGSGPRHMAVTRDERWMYVACELANTVLACSIDAGRLSLRQSLSTLPQGYGEANLAADIHFSQDETRLYVSNRGHDSLAQYAVGPDHMLTLERHIPCRGRGPRNFAVAGP